MAKRQRKVAEVAILPPIEEMPQLRVVSDNVEHGTLIAHRGAVKMTRDELSRLPLPVATDTHQPIAHIALVRSIEEQLSYRHIRVVAEEFAATPDGSKMFGIIELDEEWSGLRFALGLRNSNDKSMRLGMVAGYRVFCCDNMSFSGEFKPVAAKHSKHFDLEETITLGIHRVQRHFSPLKAQIQRWQETPLTDDQARLIIYRAFLEGGFPVRMMADVHREYFTPSYPDFEDRTFWSLSNAFTTVAKSLKPVKQFTVTAKLGSYLEAASTPF